MKKIKILNIFICFIIAINVLLIPDIAKGLVEVPDYIRVGLEYKYKNVDKIYINNKQLIMGYEIKGDFIPEAVLESSEGFYIMPSNSYFVSTNKNFDTYEEAKTYSDELKNLGFNAIPASLTFSKWDVYIGEFNSYNEAQQIKTFDEDFIIKEVSSTRTILKAKYDNILVLEGEEIYPQFLGVDFNSSEEIIDLGDRQYRGRMEFGRYNGSGITAVNIVLLEEYLYGVVPAEINPNWHMEALKAQAVVARSYAIRNMGKHKDSPYNLCDMEHCQVYKGYGIENINSNQAVEETKGELVYYNDEIIEAVYFASSGGYTEDSENVWSNSVPYLRGVEDPYETNSKTWTKSFSKSDIEELLRNNGKDIGEVLDIQIESYTSSGRVKELKIIGSRGEETLTKENIRTFFKSNGMNLESRMFTIKKGNSTGDFKISVMNKENVLENISEKQVSVIGENNEIQKLFLENSTINVQRENGIDTISISSTTSIEGDFVFEGKGYGHGVGMSQWGAKGMAEAGYDYKQILSHYYTGTTVN
ncbi:SpoIID/LytB domain-containing protein [Defluviitalea phaphyphila]|uniref:SpoIID/LytB domain-containing protein n=1 Tax=Defluviitalea phaphyphila TaxID=1473580 RepID=UPI000731CE47|nr:SpoIID/LytB domain-containing protein [Defluviitalea phaphyphila]